MERKKMFMTLLLTCLVCSLLPTIVSTSSEFSIVMQGKSGEHKPPKNGNGNGNGNGEGIQWELFIEIDYMLGHEPTQLVLDYIEGYYLERGISVTFLIDDEVPSDESVTFEEHLTYEELYNDNDNGYYSKWKWFLYGTTVEGYPNVVGYIYANQETGNYGFIAEVTSSEWATSEGLETWSSEAVVLMHELGHAIGILKLNAFGEMYDKNTESVMSYLNINNADNYGTWFYSKSYWKLKDMEYYII